MSWLDSAVMRRRAAVVPEPRILVRKRTLIRSRSRSSDAAPVNRARTPATRNTAPATRNTGPCSRGSSSRRGRSRGLLRSSCRGSGRAPVGSRGRIGLLGLRPRCARSRRRWVERRWRGARWAAEERARPSDLPAPRGGVAASFRSRVGAAARSAGSPRCGAGRTRGDPAVVRSCSGWSTPASTRAGERGRFADRDRVDGNARSAPCLRAGPVRSARTQRVPPGSPALRTFGSVGSACSAFPLSADVAFERAAARSPPQECPSRAVRWGAVRWGAVRWSAPPSGAALGARRAGGAAGVVGGVI